MCCPSAAGFKLGHHRLGGKMTAYENGERFPGAVVMLYPPSLRLCHIRRGGPCACCVAYNDATTSV